MRWDGTTICRSLYLLSLDLERDLERDLDLLSLSLLLAGRLMGLLLLLLPPPSSLRDSFLL